MPTADPDALARGRGWKYLPNYPGLWKVEGEKCLHPQRRRGKITLVCARLKGHADRPNNIGFRDRHLHDVPPEFQT